MTSVIGIDVSKAELHLCLLSPTGKPKTQCFSNDASGHQHLLRWIAKTTTAAVHVCLESTGSYGQAVATTVWQAGHHVSIVNPAQIKGFAASLMCRTKTDRVDAYVIARFCAAVRPALWNPPPEALQQLQELVRRLAAIESISQQERNRLETS